MLPLIYPEESDNDEDNPCEYPSDHPSVDPDPGTWTSKLKNYQGKDLGTRFLCPIIFVAHKVGFHGAPILRRNREIRERVRSTQIFHHGGLHQGGSLERHMKNTDFGTRLEPVGRRRLPHYNQYPVPNTQQLEGGGKICGRCQDHEGGHVQDVVKRGPFGTGREGFPCLAPQAEPLLFQIPPKTIQEGGNNQEAHQYQKLPPPCVSYLFGKTYKRP